MGTEPAAPAAPPDMGGGMDQAPDMPPADSGGLPGDDGSGGGMGGPDGGDAAATEWGWAGRW